jgi:glutathione S-transferase
LIPTITAFAASPDRGRALARDMPVRWALEEVGAPHDIRRLSFAQLKEDAHRHLQPFGQIPTYECGAVSMFESGAIVLHIALDQPGLLPQAPAARARALSWMFAAVSTVEPVVLQRENTLFMERDKAWFSERLPMVDEQVRTRLRDLSASLGAADWLHGEFSAGDLLMVQVLRRLAGSELLAEHPNLLAYVARAEARPAFQRAFAAQL